MTYWQCDNCKYVTSDEQEADNHVENTDHVMSWMYDDDREMRSSQTTTTRSHSMTPEEAIAQLDAIDYDEDSGGPGLMHEDADDILLATIPSKVAEAYKRLIDRCDWWAFS